MENDSKPAKIHPLYLATAGTVLLACLFWIASMMGLLPGSGSGNAPALPAATSPVGAANTTVPGNPAGVLPTTTTTTTTTTPAPAPEAVQQPVPKPPVVKKPVPKKVSPPPYQSTQNSDTGSRRPYDTTYDGQANARMVPQPPPPVCRDCGTIESVQTIVQQGQATGLGAAAGALLGGVLGHQVGGGDGRKLATIAGAIGGGLAGNSVEKNSRSETSDEIIVRMEDGTSVRLILSAQHWRVGDKVRVMNGNLLSR